MNITIIAIGKLKERFWTDACSEYLKRLGAYAKVNVRELADMNPAHVGGEAAAVEKEGASAIGVLDSLPADTHVVLLAIEGKQLSSVEFSQRFDTWALQGTANIAFIIGGSCGVSDAVKARAHEQISFGKITLPHNLARVVLLEQIYRAFKISHGEPYHK